MYSSLCLWMAPWKELRIGEWTSCWVLTQFLLFLSPSPPWMPMSTLMYMLLMWYKSMSPYTRFIIIIFLISLHQMLFFFEMMLTLFTNPIPFYPLRRIADKIFYQTEELEVSCTEPGLEHSCLQVDCLMLSLLLSFSIPFAYPRPTTPKPSKLDVIQMHLSTWKINTSFEAFSLGLWQILYCLS